MIVSNSEGQSGHFMRRAGSGPECEVEVEAGRQNRERRSRGRGHLRCAGLHAAAGHPAGRTAVTAHSPHRTGTAEAHRLLSRPTAPEGPCCLHSSRGQRRSVTRPRSQSQGGSLVPSAAVFQPRPRLTPGTFTISPGEATCRAAPTWANGTAGESGIPRLRGM